MALAQTSLDSLDLTAPVDSTIQKKLQKVDSIQSAFKSKTDSLQQLYREPLTKIDFARSSVQAKIDSLNTLHLPAEKFTRKMDSLTNLQNKKLAELNQKVEDLKSKATAGLKGVELPPQMQGPLNKLTQSVKDYVPTLPNGKLQEFNLPAGKLPAMKNLKLPEAKNIGELGKNIPKSDELNKVTGELGKVKEITNEVSGLAKDAQSIATGKIEEVKHIDKSIEKQALKIDPNYILARSYMGQAMISEGDFVGAREQLIQIADRGGKDSWAYTALNKALHGEATTW